MTHGTDDHAAAASQCDRWSDGPSYSGLGVASMITPLPVDSSLWDAPNTIVTPNDAHYEDLLLLRAQAERCREILSQLAGRGEQPGEVITVRWVAPSARVRVAAMPSFCSNSRWLLLKIGLVFVFVVPTTSAIWALWREPAEACLRESRMLDFNSKKLWLQCLYKYEYDE